MPAAISVEQGAGREPEDRLDGKWGKLSIYTKLCEAMRPYVISKLKRNASGPAHALSPEHRAKRGRPTAARVRAINAAILQAAREQFLSVGFDLAAMEVIAAHAGVSKVTLYARYCSKDLLLKAVIERQIELWSEQNSKIILPSLSLGECLRRYAYSVIESSYYVELREFERLASSHSGGNIVSRVLHEAGHKKLVDIVARDISEKSAKDGRPMSRNPELVADLFLSTLYGWHRMIQFSPDLPIEAGKAYADAAVDLLLNGRSAW